MTLAFRWFESNYPSQKKASRKTCFFQLYSPAASSIAHNCIVYAVIFGLRRVVFARSLCERCELLEGEYNITEAVRLQYHCRLRQYHADKVGISLKTFPTELKFWTDSNRHTPSEAFQKTFPFTICLQSHRCNGSLDRFELTNRFMTILPHFLAYK